jgi:hypothetical protein
MNTGINTMKRIFKMKKLGLLAIALAVLACEQPFKAGLGPIVDVKKPTITLLHPGPGDYLKGEILFDGIAWDDIKVESAWIMVTSHPALPTQTPGPDGYINRYASYTPLSLNSKLEWVLPIETMEFPDGDFKIRLKITDTAKKTTESDEYAFIIKNTRPTIGMAVPAVAVGSGPGKVGGNDLNWETFNDPSGQWVDDLPPSGFLRVVDTGGALVGIADDRKGIETADNPAANPPRFPPQIRFWAMEANDTNVPVFDKIPSETELPWLNLERTSVGPSTWQFTYYLTEDGTSDSGFLQADRYYAFQVRAMSTDGTITYYPQDDKPSAVKGEIGSFSDPNNCVMVYMRKPEEYPQVSLLQLQDITAAPAAGDVVNGVPPYPNLTVTPPYPYMDSENTIKRGAFTLRVRASHSMGVYQAEARWKRQGASGSANQGIVEWDRPAGVSTTDPATWGIQDPHYRPTKYFTFTYDDTPAAAARMLTDDRDGFGNRIPVATDGNGLLLEGTYEFTIYATAVGGSAVPEGQGFQASVQIDRHNPSITLTKVEGSAGTAVYNNPLNTSDPDNGKIIYTVNGVIRPDLQIAEINPLDSGPRQALGKDYYVQNPGQPVPLYGYEQRYLLVNAAGRAALDSKIASAPAGVPYWPPEEPVAAGGAVQSNYTSVDGYQVFRHGPVFDGQNPLNAFKTSQAYTSIDLPPGANDGDYLPDGSYYLYVFARDNAWNVGTGHFLLDVQKESDRPQFNLSVGGLALVSKPDQPDDYDPAHPSNTDGFVVQNGSGTAVRNKIASGAPLKIQLTDDDSLDLGVYSGAASKVSVKIAGSKLDAAGKIQAQADRALNDAAIKQIFVPNTPPVKSSTGSISQLALVSVIKDSGTFGSQTYDYLFANQDARDNAVALPEGIYRITIGIEDRPASKLDLASPPAALVSSTNQIVFWFAVDNQVPVVGTVLPAANAYISATQTVPVTGTVSDLNGPITVNAFSVTPRGSTTVDYPAALNAHNKGQVNLVRNTGVTGKWEYNFTAPVIMGGNSGTYTVTLEFVDRFGNMATLSRVYSVDKNPPTVTLTSPIRTFERQELENSAVGNVPANKSRLANKVVRFTLNATDDYQLTELKYILTTAAAPPDYTDAGYTVVNLQTRPFTMYVDTAALPDGVYYLYARAKDAAGNISSGTPALQTVYLLQEEDKPYFMDDIGPKNGRIIGTEGMIITGRVTDDDGFNTSDTNAAAPVPSPSSTATVQVDFSADGGTTWAGWRNVPAGQLTVTGTTLNLNVNLASLFSGSLGADRLKAYRLRVMDSASGTFPKYTAAGTAATERVWRDSSVYTFNLDTLAPEVKINHPKGAYSEQTKGTFEISGDVTEQNLSIETDSGSGHAGERYITWNMNSGTETKAYVTGSGSAWSFSITGPAAATIFDNLPAGMNTLTVTARDESGKEKPKQENFVKDLDPPEIKLNLSAMVTLPAAGQWGGTSYPSSEWWAAPGGTPPQQWFEEQVKWLNDTSKHSPDQALVPVIFYNAGTTAVITGTFSDAESNIDLDNITASQYENLEYRIDNGSWTKFYTSDDTPPRAYIDGSGKTVRWSIPVSTPLTDGVHSVSFRIRDALQNATAADDTNKMYAFRVDSALPLVPTAAAGGAASGGVFGKADILNPSATIFTLTGTAIDANLTDVKLTIKRSGVATPIVEDYLVSNYGVAGHGGIQQPVWLYNQPDPAHQVTGAIAAQVTWGYAVSNSVYQQLTQDIDGKYTIEIRAIDAAGKESAPPYLYEFTLDAQSPQFEFGGRNTFAGAAFGTAETVHTAALPDPKDFAPGRTNVALINRLTGNQPAISGTIQDPGNSSNLKQVQVIMEKFVYENTDALVTTKTPGTWQPLTGKWGAWNSIEDADLRITSTAAVGSAPALNWSRQLYAASPTTDSPNLTQGLYRMRLRARDSTYIQGGGDFGAGTVGGNPANSDWLYFYYDNASPALDAAGIQSYYNSNTASTITFNGTASDDNRIRNVTVQMYSTANPNTVVASGSADNPAWTSGKTAGTSAWTWNVPLTVPGTAGDGAYFIRITAVDNSGQEFSIRRDFNLDNKLPTGRFESPAYRDQSGRVLLSGGQVGEVKGITEDANGIVSVHYMIGYQGITQGTLPGDGKLAAGNLLVAANGDGSENVEGIAGVMKNHLAGLETSNGGSLSADWIAIGTQWGPAGYTSASQTVEGTQFQANMLLAVNANPYDLTFTFKDLNLLANLAAANSIPPVNRAQPLADALRAGMYSLPLWLRLVDGAGNVNYIARDIWINPDGDRPYNNVIDPVTSLITSPRGGSISAQGVAGDNISVHDVVYRVTVGQESSSGSAPANPQVVYMTGAQSLTSDELALFAAGTAGSYDAAYGNGSQWRKANMEILKAGQAVPAMPWNFTLNANDEIKNEIAAHGFISGTGSTNNTIKVRLEILVLDDAASLNAPKRFSEVVVRDFYVVSSAPSIKTVAINTIDYTTEAGKAPVAGTFTVAAVMESLSTNIRYVDYRRQGVSGWTRVLDNPQTTTLNSYNFSKVFDSKLIDASNAQDNSVMGGAWAAGGGEYRIELRVQDWLNPPGEAVYTVNLRIDNFAPAAENDGRPNQTLTNKVMAGTSEFFTGRAVDHYGAAAANTPPVREVKRVYAWLTGFDAGVEKYIKILYGAGNPNRAQMSQAATMVTFPGVYSGRQIDNSNMVTAAGTAADRNVPAVTNAVAATDVPGDQWAVDITMNNPQNGIYFSPNGGDYDKTWAFRVDTTRLPDGPVTLHYIVFDAAGNASYHTQTTTIKNRTPRIRTIAIGTDLQGLGSIGAAGTTADNMTVTVDNYRTSPYIDTGFIVKNQNVGFRVTTDLGNSPLSYRLHYARRNNTPVTVDTDDAVNFIPGRIYTIAATGGLSAASWAALGASSPEAGTHFVYNYTGTNRITDTNAKVYSYAIGKAGTSSIWTGAYKPAAGGVNPPTDWNTDLNFQGVYNAGSNPAGRFDNGTHHSPATTDGFGITQALGSNPSGTSDPAETAFFIIKVWDNVEQGTAASPVTETPSTYELRQLYDIAVIGANVYLVDDEPPAMRLYDLNPYTEEAVTGNNIDAAAQLTTLTNAANPQAVGQNIRRGGLYNTGTTRGVKKSGHIDPRNGTRAVNDAAGKVSTDTNVTGFTRDQVSGKVILRGVAQDNLLVDSIRINIGGSSTTILQLNPTTHVIEPVTPGTAWAVEKLDWETGHTVEWAYLWNAETIPNASGTPADNITVIATAHDYKMGADSAVVAIGAENPASGVWHNQINVDIVPYITGFQRDSVYATNRSKQGWYSFYQDETNISALGFHLRGTAAPTVNLTNSAGTAIINPTASTINRVTFNMPGTAASGQIKLNTGVTAGGSTENLNHRNNNIQSWNKQNHRYAAGSALWLDDIYAHIWRDTGNDTMFTGSAYSDSPAMSLQYTGTATLHGAWSVYGTAGWYKGTITSTVNTQSANARSAMQENQNEPFSYTDISYFNGKSNADNNQSRGVATYMADGSVSLHYATNGTTGRAAAWTPNGQTRDLQNNRIALYNTAPTTNSTADYQSHMTTYRFSTKSLNYVRNTTQMVIDGGGAAAGVLNNNGTATGNDFGAITGAAADAGLWSAIDYTTNGNPVIAYYDRSNDTLRLAYAGNTTPAAANWTRRYVIPVGDTYRSGSGTYVSMKIDSADNIHLAFYNTVYNTVVYAKGTTTGNFTTVAVDNAVNGGTWTDISVDGSGNPWITYMDSARAGNYDGAKIAYLDAAAFAAGSTDVNSGKANTGWEALQMPARYKVSSDRLNIEAWPPTLKGGTLATGNGVARGWNAAVGYGSDSFRVAYFTKPSL